MKKILLVIGFVMSVAGVWAQTDSMSFERPDYMAIKAVIADPDSEFYYPDLMERMKQYDTTLTVGQYKALYYGSLFQPGVSMLSINQQETEMMPYYQSDSLSPNQYDQVIGIIQRILESDPFYLRGLNFLGYVLHLKGDEEEAMKTAGRFGKTLEVILSSGDGLSPETGFHVIYAGHEYVVLNVFELIYKSRETQWIGHDAVDCFTLRGKRPGKLYFYLPYSLADLQAE